MTVRPVETPATMPEADPIVAMPGDPELQEPPEMVSDKVKPEPAHNAEGPAMTDGNALTVTTAVATQPDPIE